MKKFRYLKNKSIKYEIATVCTVFAILLIVLGSFIYSVFYERSQQDAVDSNAAAISSTKEKLELLINDVDVMNLKLFERVDNRNLADIYYPPSAQQRNHIQEFAKEFRKIILTNISEFDDHIIYLPKSKYCIGRSYTSAADTAFNTMFGISGEELNGFTKELRNASDLTIMKKKVMLGSNRFEDCLLFIHRYPYTSDDSVVISIYIVAAERLFNDVDEEKSASDIAVFDSDGKILAQKGFKNIKFETFLSEEETDKYAEQNNAVIGKDKTRGVNLTVFASTRRNYFEKENILLIAIFISIAVILVLILICTLFINYFRVTKILGKTEGMGETISVEGENEYNILSNVIDKFKNESENANRSLFKLRSMMCDEHIEKFLCNDLDYAKIVDILKRYDKEINGKWFCIVIFNILNGYEIFNDDDSMTLSERMDYGRFIINNIAEELLGTQCCARLFTVERKNLAIIGIDELTDDIDEEIKNILENIQKCVEEKFGFSFSVACSKFIDAVEKLPLAYTQASRLLDYNILYEDDVILFNEDLENKDAAVYFYPLEKEQCLVSYIKEGNINEAKSELNEIFEVNFKTGLLPTTYIKCLMFDIASTMIKILQDVKSNSGEIFTDKMMEDLILSIVDCESISKMKRMLEDILENVCEYYFHITESDFGLEIIKFIEKNYSDRNLSVEMIASYMNIHPNYLSLQFKKKTGKNLASYISSYRIEQFKKLIVEQNITIEKAANQVGYDNYRSLIRIFKSREGITPSEYKKLFRRKAAEYN